MASPHPFHERRGAVSDTAPNQFRVYALSPLAASLDSMVKMAS